MSDYESTIFDGALEARADWEHQKYRADLQEQAEITLAEVLRDLNIDDLVRNQRDLEPYRDPLHAAVRILVDKVQEMIRQTSKQRAEALQLAAKEKKRLTEMRWADRTQKALKMKRNNPKLSASEIARQVMDDEIEDNHITDDKKADYLFDTVSETLRKRLGQNAEFKAIK